MVSQSFECLFTFLCGLLVLYKFKIFIQSNAIGFGFWVFCHNIIKRYFLFSKLKFYFKILYFLIIYLEFVFSMARGSNLMNIHFSQYHDYPFPPDLKCCLYNILNSLIHSIFEFFASVSHLSIQ